MRYLLITYMHVGTGFYSSLFVYQSCVTEHTLAILVIVLNMIWCMQIDSPNYTH